MDSVGAFNVFVQVAKTRSFVAAGRHLGVSASAVGQSVARLEERLGARLFHRSTRSIALTAEGTRFLERSRRILSEIEAAEADISQTVMEPRGVLRVSLPILGEPFLRVLGDFTLAYPSVELDLDFTDRRVDIIEEGFDAVIRSGEVQDSRLTARRLGGFRRLLIGAPQYFEKRGVPKHPNDLVHHSCLMFRFPNTGKLQPWPLTGEGVIADLQPPTSMISNNLAARLSFALQGLGIACVGDYAVRDALREGKLVSVLEDYVRGDDAFHILWPSGGHPAPKLRVFIDFLKGHLFSESGKA